MVVRRLLVPLDQSKLAESALPLARGLARQLALPVTLFSVVEAPSSLARAQGVSREATPAGGGGTDPLMPAAGASSSTISPTDLEKLAERVSQAEAYLRGIADTFPEINVETEVMYGEAADRILSFAETRNDPALVMASHGRTGLARMLLGSVTSRVVQATNLPVFVVRGKDSSPSGDERQVNNLLVPLDESSFSAQALVTVRSIFGANPLTVHLLRVVETQRSRGAYEYAMNEEFAQSARRDREAQLEEKARQLRAHGYSVTCELSQGRVADQINKFSESLDVDLIAMATHGSNADLRRFMLGSVAEQVLNEAHRPLLLIRPQD
jgi:nucleotide-binding universal stress UspA family protein